MSSDDIKKALDDSGLTIPAGGVPLTGDAQEEPIAGCTLFHCMFVCAQGCWGPCETSCMLGCSNACFNIGPFGATGT